MNLLSKYVSYIKSKAIRHPIIEKLHQSTQYNPNDICLGKTKDNNGNEIMSSDLQDGILLFGIKQKSLMSSSGIRPAQESNIWTTSAPAFI